MLIFSIQFTNLYHSFFTSMRGMTNMDSNSNCKVAHALFISTQYVQSLFLVDINNHCISILTNVASPLPLQQLKGLIYFVFANLLLEYACAIILPLSVLFSGRLNANLRNLEYLRSTNLIVSQHAKH